MDFVAGAGAGGGGRSHYLFEEKKKLIQVLKEAPGRKHVRVLSFALALPEAVTHSFFNKKER